MYFGIKKKWKIFGKSKTSAEKNQICIRFAQINSFCKAGNDIDSICEEIDCLRRTSWKWIDRFLKNNNWNKTKKIQSFTYRKRIIKIHEYITLQ